jgi:hypothetical protein
MTERERLEMHDAAMLLWMRQEGRCAACDGRMRLWDDHVQIAHIIPQSRRNRRKYGDRVLHDPRNLRLVCSLRCNSDVAIGQDRERERRLVDTIRSEL